MNYPISECVVDGCERGPFDTEAAYRGHVNGSAEPGHDWADVQDQLTDAPEPAESGDGDNKDTPEEGDTEGDEPHPEGTQTGEQDGDTDDMPTQDEYEDQHATADADGSTDGDNGDSSAATGDGLTPSLPMDPKTLGMLLAIALVLWLSYRALSGSDNTDQSAAPSEGTGSGDGTTHTDGEIQGGLAQ